MVMAPKRPITSFFGALTVSTIWTFFNRYEYVGHNTFLFDKINVFPLVLWTVGLTLLYIVHTRKQTRYRLLFTTIFYLVAIALVEAFGYYILNIRLNSNEPSLLHTGIIHAPVHMQIFYVIAGPVYIIIISWVLQLLYPFPKQKKQRA